MPEAYSTGFVIERILREPKVEDKKIFESLKMLIARTFEKNLAMPVEELLEARYNRFRKIGDCTDL